jgi:hypothetical protein
MSLIANVYGYLIIPYATYGIPWITGFNLPVMEESQ